MSHLISVPPGFLDVPNGIFQSKTVAIMQLHVLDHFGQENYQTNVFLYGLYYMFHLKHPNQPN
jgi:hypothetical protein